MWLLRREMWRCTDGTGMICQSCNTTRHYREEHNIVIEKRDVALYRWYRYDMPVI